MSPNIGGGVILPGAYSESEVVTNGLNLPGANRVLCIMGEGVRREVIVNYAAGNGLDGLNSSYTSSTNADGRHFQLSQFPIVTNRLVLLKNGVPLVGLEQTPSSTPFSNLYDYRVDITTGKIELQGAYLYDQGGAYYTVVGTIIGNGTINSLELIDVNAPEETWTIRCSSVRRDAYGNPVDGYAKFTAMGSVSGVVLDGYGKPVVWQSDSINRNNGILSFSISEGSTAFNVGDTFKVIVKSGVLKTGDNLIAEYIAELDINDPVLQTNMDDIKNRYGSPSLTNTLSLGCQLAFANGTPAVLCIQTAPSIPRRTSHVLIENGTGGTALSDLEIPLPIGYIPDINSQVNFFVVNNVTGQETQILPNKVDFYDATITSNPSDFIYNGQPYSYTVIYPDNSGVTKEGEDAVVTPGLANVAVISSPTITFDLSDTGVSMSVTLFDATNANNNGNFTVLSVSNGKLTIQGVAPFTSESNVKFRVIDSTQKSAEILLTQDLAIQSGQGLRITFIDTKDSTFYDAGWSNALTKLEAFELDVLVPLPRQTISAIFGTCKQHVLKMSQIKNRKERVLIIGAIQGLTPDNVTGVKPAAVEDIGVLEGIQGDSATEILAGNVEDLTNYSVPDAFGNTYRISYMYPDRIVVSIDGSNTYLDGFYLAAAYGGLIAATGNVNTPFTNKTLAGFSILRDRTFNTTTAEQLVKAGIVLVEPVLGGGRIVWGLTTSQSGFIEDQEESIVFIRDYVSKAARTATQGFVGLPESPTFQISLQSRILALMTALVSQNIITKYGDIIINRDSVDPRQWDITTKFQPNYPVGWIYIKFQVGTF